MFYFNGILIFYFLFHNHSKKYQESNLWKGNLLFVPIIRDYNYTRLIIFVKLCNCHILYKNDHFRIRRQPVPAGTESVGIFLLREKRWQPQHVSQSGSVPFSALSFDDQMFIGREGFFMCAEKSLMLYYRFTTDITCSKGTECSHDGV